MGKNIFISLTILLAILAMPIAARAENVSGQSARLFISNRAESVRLVQNPEQFYARKKLAIKRVLESPRFQDAQGNPPPLASHVDDFINACRTYNLDCYLLPSISGIESQFGKMVSPNSYNAFGWGRGLTPFKDWGEGIMTVGEGIRTNYMDKWGLSTIEEIGPRYCEGNTWAGKVLYFKAMFDAEEANMPTSVANAL